MYRAPAIQRRARRGFTLIDVAMATAIIGTAVVALSSLLAAGTATSVDSAQQTQANSLIRGIREMCFTKRYSELRSLHNRSYSPPVDSRGLEISVLSQWKQTITVQPVDPHRLTTDVIDSDADALRITVTAYSNDQEIEQESWYSFKVDSR